MWVCCQLGSCLLFRAALPAITSSAQDPQTHTLEKISYSKQLPWLLVTFRIIHGSAQ